MSRKKTVWIPAVLSVIIAILFVAYYLYTWSSHGRGMVEPHPPKGGEGERAAGLFSTMGTMALYIAAAGFSWFWFKKKLRSPAKWVRLAGKIFHAAHKWLGWLTLLLIAIHGAFFLVTKLHDKHIFTGLAAFAILLAIAGYGYSIPVIRNIWMRRVHRTLGIVWIPLLWLHAGGSAIIAVIATLAVGGIAAMLHKKAVKDARAIQDR
ncbi:hypothetical protein [Paenibacillus glycinis]|uniref:Ferric oxidoreductase domain-containing protein n=1 Tax=Paenibacillus glycinis TaxID=2697035 RepID=A0ABW9XQT4_9BACL|nr:hypothetical protein [Paenibacillus glycinis]NBD25007.1 hypothetical protein [Paenibacillus glycinis]